MSKLRVESSAGTCSARFAGRGSMKAGGRWGENPVYHEPVFLLTHHARAPLVMQGGTP